MGDNRKIIRKQIRDVWYRTDDTFFLDTINCTFYCSCSTILQTFAKYKKDDGCFGPKIHEVDKNIIVYDGTTYEYERHCLLNKRHKRYEKLKTNI